MLRSALSRPLAYRRFSTSLRAWNVSSSSDSSSTGASNSAYSADGATDGTHNHANFSSSSPTEKLAPDESSFSPTSLYTVKQRFRNWSEQAAITVRNRADDFTDTAQTTFSQLGAHLNRVTGYEGIEALKRSVVEQEARIKETRAAAREAKARYEAAVLQRSNSQREVNDLLQRKSHWTDGDVGRFTTLVRQDHMFEQEEAHAKAAVHETDQAVEKEFSELMRTILERYHEEQVWSDKIRSASTYGSLAALGLNLVVFVLAIVIVEPWKRRRLAQTFEAKVEQLSRDSSARIDASMEKIDQKMQSQEQLLAKFADDFWRVSEPPSEDAIREALTEIESDEERRVEAPTRISRRQLELGAAAAAAFAAGVLSSLWFGR